jgi:hypothetical protein
MIAALWCMNCGKPLSQHRSPQPYRPGNPQMSDGIATPAVRAPDFPDTLDWVHTAGRRLTLGDFRGKLLLLDFWTYG